MEDPRAGVQEGLCEWVLAGGLVCQDVGCEKCGYSLKTLAVGGRCPECGEAVAGSVRAGRLCFADIDWMKRVRWGMRMPLIGLLWWLVAVFGLSMTSGVIGLGNWELGMVGCGALPAVTLVLLGVFLTTQAQGPVGSAFVGLTRYGLLARAAVAVWVGCMGIVLLGGTHVPGDGVWFWLVMALPTVALLVFCIALVGLMMHLREIGRVTGSVGLRRRCWLAVGCVAAAWCTAGLGAGLSWVGVTSTGWVGTAIAIVLLVATWLGLLAALASLFSASGVMGRQIALARRVRGVG